MISNPYVKGAEGRQEWNDRYDNMRQSISYWRKAFFCAIAMSILFALIMAKMASQSRIEPFVVETNEGVPYAVKAMSSMSLHDERLINFAINQFIINARTILHDTAAEKTLLDKVYAYSANHTLGFLRDFYQKNDPYELSNHYTITVNIINSLPLSHDTWQITWDEIKRSTSDGNMISTTRWMANISYQFGDVNPNFISDNPFGFYITQLSWAQNHI